MTLGSLFAIFEPWIWRRLGPVPACFYFIETIQHEIEIGKIIHAVLFDLSKAFDSLSHPVLLKKLQSLHCLPSAMKIVESFSTGRLHQVYVKGVQSEWIELKQEILQGIVKGPLCTCM